MRNGTIWVHLCRFALILLLAAVLAPSLAASQDLVRVPWRDALDLRALDALGLDIRFVGRGEVLVSCGPEDAGRIRALGLAAQSLETERSDEQYVIGLPDHVHAAAPPPSVRPIHQTEAYAILAAPHDVLAGLPASCGWALAELPHGVSVRSWLADPAAKRLRIRERQSQVEGLIAAVSTDRIRADIEALVYFDPSFPYDNAPSNLRTRYARRVGESDDGADRAARYLLEKLREALGPDADVRLEPFRHSPEEPEMKNVVAVQPGTDPAAGHYILCGHYDSIVSPTRFEWDWRTEPAPGADDNATGVAAILETARILAPLEFAWGIKYILFSGEELRLWGSRAYTEAARARGDRILGAFNLDMLGYNNFHDVVDVTGNPASRHLVELMRETHQVYDLGIRLFPREREVLPNSDHWQFWVHGFDAVMISEHVAPQRDGQELDSRGRPYFHANRQFHSLADVADSLNWRLLTKDVQLIVAALGQFAEAVEPADLALYPGDLKVGEGGRIAVTIHNLAGGGVSGPVALELEVCSLDSASCQPVWSEEITGGIPAGGAAVVEVDTDTIGKVLFRATVDPDGALPDGARGNNVAYLLATVLPEAGVTVFPNPYVVTQAVAPGITFLGVRDDSALSIYSAAGELVWRSDARKGEITWNLANRSGFLVGTGTYVYRATDRSGARVEGKLAVIR